MKSKMQKFSLSQKKTRNIKRKNEFKKIQEKRRKKRKTDDEEIEALNSRIWPSFDQPKEKILPEDIKTFSDLPISKKTLEGLKKHNFTTPTDIQRQSLMFGLEGCDILGAAKTGSGKTLAFLIPILETLFKQRYSPAFGLAALVITPTRELAYQIFDVLKKIGRYHDLSFGLVIGGMPLKEEAKRMNTTNIVICTPGRLLQHFEQTPNFTADELKILVLDEADQILDMGFAKPMDAIIEALPKQRQTLLFSATQTKSVKDLARLSLKKAKYVSAHEKAKETTPEALNQRYVICELQDKVNTLWSFLKSHKHKKIIVFLSCCKQTRYLYQVFKKMKPGSTIFCIHGHMAQHQRTEVYNHFSRKQHAVLMATDVAARGLDFPAVHWVVQVDKPENVFTYIHRVGRTARYEKSGEAVLFLLPPEEKKMVEDLQKKKIPIKKMPVKKNMIFDVTKNLQSLCASDKDLKDNAQRAFIASMKTLFVLDKPTFETIDVEAYAVSLGLVQAPVLSFLTKDKKKAVTSTAEESDSEDGSTAKDSDSSEEEEEAPKDSNWLGKKMAINFGVNDEDNENDENIYKVVKNIKVGETSEKAEQVDQNVNSNEVSKKKKSTAKEKLKLLKLAKRITFDEDGRPEGDDSDSDTGGLNVEKAKIRMKESDKVDKEMHRQRIKQLHREKRLKEKEKRRLKEMEKRGQSKEENEVSLGSPHEGEEENDEDEMSDNSDNKASSDNNNGSSEDDNSDDNSSDDEPQPKKRKIEKKQLDVDTDDSKESESSDEEMHDDLVNDEAMALALLGQN